MNKTCKRTSKEIKINNELHVGGNRFQACPAGLQVLEVGPDRICPASHEKVATVLAGYPLGSSIRGWL